MHRSPHRRRSAHRAVGLLLALTLPSLSRPAAPEEAKPEGLQRLGTFEHVELGDLPLFTLVHDEGKALMYRSQMMVDTDGAFDAYHPDDIGITHLCNGISVGSDCRWKADCMADFRRARAEGYKGPTKICFFGMVADDDGVPVIQGADDPRPGYFVSATSLAQPGSSARDPRAYLDSNAISYVVIPRAWHKQRYGGVGLGDLAVVLRKSNGKLSFAIVGDLGPNRKLGEGSVRLHLALENDPFGNRYGKRRAFKGIGSRDVVYGIFPGSRLEDQVVTEELIDREGARLLERLGGEARFREYAGGL